MKKTNKTFKPAYIVDMTDVKNADELALAFVIAKVNAGVAITGNELKNTIEYFANQIADEAANTIAAVIASVAMFEAEKIKRPWYKRFWRWITRKNK